jgi:aminoglycoside/choline kinase family phosphotransferase
MRAEASALRSLEAADAAWFGRALSERFPGVEVLKAEPGTIIRGMATKAQYFLDYNEAGRAHGLPRSMWLKAGLEAHSEASAPLYAAEVNFYRDLAPRLAINSPKTFFEAIDRETGSGVLLLEDLTLRNVRFGRPTDRIDLAGAKRVLELMARYNPVPQLQQFAGGKLAWLEAASAIDTANVIDLYLGFWDTAALQPRFRHVPNALMDRERMRRAVHAMRDNDRFGPRAWLVHGDGHMGNMFFEQDGAPGLLDWQTAMLGDWASDVSEFLVFSLDVETRRAHERDLIAHYLAALGASGVAAPSFEDAWLTYRRHAAWSFLTVMCPVEMHPEEVCTIWAERACAAIVDLETLKALGV